MKSLLFSTSLKLYLIFSIIALLDIAIYAHDSPYELPVIRSAEEFDNIIYIDPSGNNGIGTIDSPYNSLNKLTIQPNTAYLLKRGTVLDEKVGRLQAEDFHRVLDVMVWSDNYIGAYGDGERPVVKGFFIWEGSDGLTIRDIEIRAESQWPSGWDAVVYIHNVNVRNITVAYCGISGLYNDSYQKSYPYVQPEGPFAYPVYGVKAQGSNLTFYKNIIRDVWSTGLWIGTSDDLRIVKNWIYNVVKSKDYIVLTQKMLAENPDNISGNCLSLQWEYENLYVAGNILDKSASEWKAAFSLGYQKGWESVKRGYVIEYNTLISPKAGSGGSGIYFVAPPESYLRYNVIDATNKGTQPGVTPITSAGTLIRDHLRQKNPVYVHDNYIIRHKPGSAVTYPNSDLYLDSSNKLFNTYEEYIDYIQNPENRAYGSDIDTTNFWD